MFGTLTLFLVFVFVGVVCGDVALVPYGDRVPAEIMSQRFSVRDSFALIQVQASDPPIYCQYSPYDVHADGDFVGTEVAALQRVIDAKKALPQRGAEVHFSVFNLRNPRVIAKLKEAHQVGVVVQVLIEGEKISAEQPWNTVDEDLASVGVPVYLTREEWLAKGDKTASALIGVALPRRGSFHSKIRHFRWFDSDSDNDIRDVVFSGSQNPNDESMANDEVLCLIRDLTLRSRYIEFWGALIAGKEAAYRNEWNPNGHNVLLDPNTGHDFADRVLEWIDAEKELVVICMFSIALFDSPQRDGYTLYHALEAANARGVMILMILDWKFSEKDDLVWKLKRTGWSNLHIYEVQNMVGEWNAMHLKDVVTWSGRRLITDSTNWSFLSMGSSYRLDTKLNFVKKRKYDPASSVETMLFIQNDTFTAARALKVHFRVLEKYWYQHQQLPAGSKRGFNSLPPWELWKKIVQRVVLPFQRTTLYVKKDTVSGQYVGLRGSVCRESDGYCGIERAIEYSNYWNKDALDLKVSLRHLTWSTSAALDWVCDAATWNARQDKATYAEFGYGYDPELEATAGQEKKSPTYWKFQAYVDGSPDEFLAFKLVLTQGPGGKVLRWESNVPSQPSEVPSSLKTNINHLARLGQVTIAEWQ